MNNKILSLVLLAWIATTGFAGISAASNSQINSKFRSKTEIGQLFDKIESGETLTEDEQAILDAAKENMGERGMKKWFDGFGKRAGFNELTQEEITALESMSDEEKQAFFAEKKAEMIAQKDAEKAVIDTLIAGQTLSADQEALRLEMLARFDEENTNKRQWTAIIEKILAGDELSADELITLEEMQEKHAERQAQRAVMDAIKVKIDAGEELTADEQAILESKKSMKGEQKSRKGHRGENENNNDEEENDDTSDESESA